MFLLSMGYLHTLIYLNDERRLATDINPFLTLLWRTGPKRLCGIAGLEPNLKESKDILSSELMLLVVV